MLVLSVIDLNLLTVAGPGLCFGFLLNTALTREHSVDNTDVFVIGEKCLHTAKASSAFCTVSHVGEEARGTWEVGRRPRQER